MSAADADSILVQFQEFTGSNDLHYSLKLLQENGWNLEGAIQQHFMKVDSGEQHLNLTEPVTEPSTSCCNSDNGEDWPLFEDAFTSGHCSESYLSPDCKPRLINFLINCMDQQLTLALLDNCCVGQLKEDISRHANVPVDEITLRGWIHKNDLLIHDTDILRDLRLPKENELTVRTPHNNNICSPTSCTKAAEAPVTRTYELDIHFLDNDKHHVMKFPGSKTIRQVQEDLSVLAGPVRLQMWHGWPVTDYTQTLDECGMDCPVHQLTVRSDVQKCRNVQHAQTETSAVDSDACEDDDIAADDSETSDCESLSDEELETPAVCRPRPLIPESIKSPLCATEHFCREFASRYGEVHPTFFFGSLEEAMRESLQCKARDRKLLAVYVHHDHSAYATFFCKQVLCSPSIIDILSEFFMLWPWDVTHDALRSTFLCDCERLFDEATSTAVSMLSVDQLPALLIVSHNCGANKLVEIIHGNSALSDVIHYLMHWVDIFRQIQCTNIREEEEKEQRDLVLQEQDAAYQQSLTADRAKCKLKLEEEDRKQQEQERQERLELEKQRALERLPVEPDADCSTAPLTTVRVRCPDGRQLTRRFLATHTVADLLSFMTSLGCLAAEHRLLVCYPRRDLSECDRSTTLQQLGLAKCETLIVEKL